MQIQKNISLEGANHRLFLLDAYYKSDGNPKPVVIFTHGFKGFKDWGHWHLIAKSFAAAGFVFIKYNFSHNGTTLDAPLDFDDLEAFGQNNYSKELADMDAVLNYLESDNCQIPKAEYDLNNLTLIGHSRGGGVSIIKAKDERVKAVIGWASVSRLDYGWRGNEMLLENWKKQGVQHIFNGRTKQQMPLYFQLAEDFEANKEQFDTKTVLAELNKPFLIIHGSQDPTVPLTAVKQLQEWAKNSRLHIIDGADHVFNGRHPFEEEHLPSQAKELVEESITFLKENFQ